MVDIRPATPSDLEAVLALHRDFFAEDGYPLHEEESRTNLARLLAEPGLGRVFVIDEDGRAVGYLVLTFGFSLEFGGRDGLVDELYVAPGATPEQFPDLQEALAWLDAERVPGAHPDDWYGLAPLSTEAVQ